MNKKIGLFCALLLLLPSVAWAEEAPEGVKVVAEGYSYLGDDTSIKEARAKAMAEAERAALEQGVPIYLESYTKVKNYQLDTDEIKSRMKGYIKNKKVLVDELDKEELKYKIKIEAVVLYKEEEQGAKEETEEVEKKGEVEEIRIRGAERIDGPEPIWRPLPRDFRPTPAEPCRFTPQRLERLWDEVEELRRNRPKKFIHLVELLYPNIQPKRVVPHLSTIRRHNPRKFNRIMALIFPEIGRIPHLERPALRRKVAGRLRHILGNNPNRYIKFVRLALPRFTAPEFRSRLQQLCNKRPQLMERVEDLLRG